jgi:DMSO/TMAO reductase YedYZ molybdopterin-dependent catalytic subunit
MANDEIPERVLASRQALRDRQLAAEGGVPSRAGRALGSGPPNRHGLPRMPVGQTPTAPGKWPVLDLGHRPRISLDEWELRVDGECRAPLRLDWRAFQALEQVDDVSDFHCVTGWSKLGTAWRGVRVSTVAALAEPSDAARFAIFHAYDGYTTNLPLEAALADDVLLVHRADGRPLALEHGGPVRVITPRLYAWKGAKWVHRIELARLDRKGTWERAGYSNSADPWSNDRYAR